MTLLQTNLTTRKDSILVRCAVFSSINTMHHNFKDISGQKFNKLRVLKFIKKENDNKSYWLCRCDCGVETVVRGDSLKNGNTKSCGCFKLKHQKRKESIRPKICKSKSHYRKNNIDVFRIWVTMRQRCFYKKHIGYKYYGGRGITVCDRWLKFDLFFKDMGKRPSKKHSIDRIDNNGNYEPNNCRWATRKEQARNRKNNILVTYKGKTLCVKEWSEKLNINYRCLLRRINSGWNIDEAFIKR